MALLPGFLKYQRREPGCRTTDEQRSSCFESKFQFCQSWIRCHKTSSFPLLQSMLKKASVCQRQAISCIIQRYKTTCRVELLCKMVFLLGRVDLNQILCFRWEKNRHCPKTSVDYRVKLFHAWIDSIETVRWYLLACTLLAWKLLASHLLAFLCLVTLARIVVNCAICSHKPFSRPPAKLGEGRKA